MDERGSAKAWALAFVVAIVVGFAALIGAGCAVGANVCPFAKGAPFTSTDGAQIFAHSCAGCHGVNGEGGRGPSLIAGEGGALTYDELVNKISHGRPFYGMPAFKLGSRKLSSEQIAGVAKYVATTLRGKQ
jgi:mono/diheme cytochrome c family protein